MAVLQVLARAALKGNRHESCEIPHFSALNRMLLRGTAWGTVTPENKKPQVNQLLRALFWRRGWDSNPRYLTVRLISSQVHSATLPPLQCVVATILAGWMIVSSLFRPRAPKESPGRPCKVAARPGYRHRHRRAGSFPAPPPACGPRPGRSHSGCARTRSFPGNS